MTEKTAHKSARWYESWTFLIIICLGVPILFRSLFFAPFHIPSGSMKPTLLVGDFIFVSKSAYGYSRYSFPLSVKFFDGRMQSTPPQRGDVIVFRPPPTPHTDYIKRLIGMPGDIIQMKDSKLYLNGRPVPRQQIEDFVETTRDGSVKRYKQYVETLPNGISYHILDETPNGRLDNTPIFTVPEGHYFFMGDNRDNSADSRTKTAGYVPLENLVGRAEVIFLSTSSRLWKIWKWPGSFRSDRFWQSISAKATE